MASAISSDSRPAFPQGALCAPCFLRLLRIAALSLLLTAPAWSAEQVYLTPEAFVARSFAQPPRAQSLWLTDDLKTQLQKVLGHAPPVLRLRYWREGLRSLWILEEIGKEEYITAGFVVDGGRLVDTAVLVFRETRGWEIKFPSFTKQFDGARLRGGELDRRIDGITGATLSVNAMRGMARAALLLDAHVQSHEPP